MKINMGCSFNNPQLFWVSGSFKQALCFRKAGMPVTITGNDQNRGVERGQRCDRFKLTGPDIQSQRKLPGEQMCEISDC